MQIILFLRWCYTKSGTDYTIAASTITFTTAPASGLSFFGLLLGAGINTATVADQVITNAKISNSAGIAGSKIAPIFQPLMLLLQDSWFLQKLLQHKEVI